MQHIQLQRNLNFTTEDLRDNRDGRISEAQHERHKPPEVSKLAMYVIIGHAVAITGVLAAIALATGSPAMWIVVSCVFIAGLAPFVVLQNEGNINPTLRGDVERGTVKQQCGIAIVTEHKSRGGIRYELYISGLTLILTSKQAGAFINEQDYCVYYLPLSKTLLSAEPYDPTSD